MWDLLDTLDLEELTKLLNQTDFVRTGNFWKTRFFSENRINLRLEGRGV